MLFLFSLVCRTNVTLRCSWVKASRQRHENPGRLRWGLKSLLEASNTAGCQLRHRHVPKAQSERLNGETGAGLREAERAHIGNAQKAILPPKHKATLSCQQRAIHSVTLGTSCRSGHGSQNCRSPNREICIRPVLLQGLQQATAKGL